MKTLINLICLLLLSPFFLQSQILFKLEPLADSTGWGVYVKYDIDSLPDLDRWKNLPQKPSNNVDLGSGQVTIVAPTGFHFQKLRDINGNWTQNARVNSPIENSEFDYISVGYSSSFPPDALSFGDEVLLFTFGSNGSCPKGMHLIEKDDPFNNLPNSAGNNPRNNFDALDKGFAPRFYAYSFIGNYKDSIGISDYNLTTFGELGLKIEMLADRSSLGVFLIDDGIGQSPHRSEGGGLISLVASTRFSFKNLKSVNGNWSVYKRTNRPTENPKFDYINFKSSTNFEIDSLPQNNPILLFSLEPIDGCPEDLHLKNFNDPFNAPNSKGTNPLNDVNFYDAKNDILYETKFIYKDSIKLCPRGSESSSSLKKEFFGKTLKIFPNPSNGSFKIESVALNKNSDHLIITNNLGQTVFKTEIINSETNIELDVPIGIYSISIFNKGQFLITKRIIITK